jgi:peptidyl-prolyl cis-trans isomerase C
MMQSPLNESAGAMTGTTAATLARVNGVPLHRADESPTTEELRQRAYTELLRQAAQAEGLLDAGDVASADGVISAGAGAAVEALLERRLNVPEPAEDACRRHYGAHAQDYRTGERARVRHILFALTPGMDVAVLRKRAEACLLDVRCHDGSGGDEFARSAREYSNCPSGADGGDLGWLEAADCAPEFAREVFGQVQVGVLPQLVHSRFGLHVVEVLGREAGIDQSFDSVRGTVAMALRQQSYVTALRQYLSLLAGGADIEGIDLEAADTPLVQ